MRACVRAFSHKKKTHTHILERNKLCGLLLANAYNIIKKHSSSEIVDTHLCKLCVILRSRVLLGVRPLQVFFRTLLFSSFWTSRGHRCRPFSPPVLVFNFIAHRVQQSIPLLVHVSSSVAYSRSRVFRRSICAQQEVPNNYALGGIRTHETDLYQARG